MYFTTEVPMQYWALALVGLNSSSWQPLADFADTGKHASSNEPGFSVRAMLPMCLCGICCWEENIWTKSAGFCAAICPVQSLALSKGQKGVKGVEMGPTPDIMSQYALYKKVKNKRSPTFPLF